MPFQRYYVKRMISWINLWIHRLIHLCFLIFLKVWLTFSQCYFWCVVSHQGDAILNSIFIKNLSKPSQNPSKSAIAGSHYPVIRCVRPSEIILLWLRFFLLRKCLFWFYSILYGQLFIVFREHWNRETIGWREMRLLIAIVGILYRLRHRHIAPST